MFNVLCSMFKGRSHTSALSHSSPSHTALWLCLETYLIPSSALT